MLFGGSRPWLKNYAAGVRPQLDYPEAPLYQWLDDAAATCPDVPAVVFDGSVMTYRQLGGEAGRIARALAGIGVKKGDRVSIVLPNCPQLVAAFYGTLKTGAAAVFINPACTDGELEYKLSNSGAETVFIFDANFARLQGIKKKTAVKNVIIAGGDGGSGFAGEGLYLFSDLLRETGDPFSPPQIDPFTDLALIQYTGGTTGISKGVMLTHYNLAANALQTREAVAGCLPSVGGRILAALPLFHIYGVTLVMNLALAVAGVQIILPRFEAVSILKAVNDYKPDLFPGTPAVFSAFVRNAGLQNYNVSSIKAGISVSAPLPAEVARGFEAATGGRLVEGYGLTEASPMIAANPLAGERRHGSIGQPLPDTDCAIVNLDTGEKELPPGEIGELVIRGPQVMKGYWNRPEETACALRGGWLFTGDVARMDEEGYIYVVNRKKSVISTNFFSVKPRDVEDVLYEHPKITEAVVLGVSDLYGVEVVKAYIVLKEGETATADEIISFCGERLAAYQVPKEVEFRESLPKTVVGKVLRRVLLEEERSRRPAAGAEGSANS